jgi:hypothetical protein
MDKTIKAKVRATNNVAKTFDEDAETARDFVAERIKDVQEAVVFHHALAAAVDKDTSLTYMLAAVKELQKAAAAAEKKKQQPKKATKKGSASPSSSA